MSGAVDNSAKLRVIHFVTGGGSGATKVALDVACGHLRRDRVEPLLVLRRKAAPLPAAMHEQIAATGLRTAWVDSGFKWRTLRQLAAVIGQFGPTVFVAHGYSEHLWGRQAALAARVPVTIHIEHNLERYSFWRLWRARKLAAHTSATVGVSHGVAARVRELGIASARTEVIHNSIDFDRFGRHAPPFSARPPDIVMAARFARQKDHPTLLRAVARLVATGWTGRVFLAGGGKSSHRKRAASLAAKLGISDRVVFAGQVSDMPALYHRCRAAVLATHYEGFGLAVAESMAAGCAAIGSAVCGITDIIQPQKNGWLVPPGDSAALAAALSEALAGGETVHTLVARGQAEVRTRFSTEKQLDAYEALFAELAARPTG